MKKEIAIKIVAAYKSDKEKAEKKQDRYSLAKSYLFPCV